ncbi:hypothetical protein ACIRPT_27375 [Streptomyces sp. NPDC101227]|uniref:PspA-associated protein PspAA n=1 Tax=Streptomyces sp. NPDC101227 TaxID=3366136 RepID=UPI0038286EB5
MIAQIAGEGRWELDEASLAKLNVLDNQMMERMEAGDEPGFHQALTDLLAGVRQLGAPVPDGSTEPEFCLPSADLPFEGVLEMLTDDGLIPG